MKRHKKLFAIALLPLALTGCQTTEETAANMQSKWVGQPSDAFFAAYGPPRTRFPMSNGNTLYTWRGGEQQVAVAQAPKPYKPFNHQTSTNTFNRGFSNSSTKVTQVSPTMIKSTTKTTSGSVNFDLDKFMSSVAGTQKPAQRTRLAYCEVQITTNPSGLIINMSNTGDTAGVGFSLSRCAEVIK